VSGGTLARREDVEPILRDLRETLAAFVVSGGERADWLDAMARVKKALGEASGLKLAPALDTWRAIPSNWRDYENAWKVRQEPRWVSWQRMHLYLTGLVGAHFGAERSACPGCGMFTIDDPRAVEAAFQEFCPVCGHDASRYASSWSRHDRRRALRDRPPLREPFMFEIPGAGGFTEAAAPPSRSDA
jgi:hypothetical protein